MDHAGAHNGERRFQRQLYRRNGNRSKLISISKDGSSYDMPVFLEHVHRCSLHKMVIGESSFLVGRISTHYEATESTFQK